MCVFTLGKAKYPKNQNDFTIKCHGDILQHGFYSATLQPDCPIGKACWELFCLVYGTHPDGQMQSNKDIIPGLCQWPTDGSYKSLKEKQKEPTG